jgi:hypothetical protein
MTKQEIFDKVATHLLTQNEKSWFFTGKSFLCRYRGDNGTKCAVGVLIPDEKYRECFENKRASTIAAEYMPEFEPHAVFLDELQHIHDSVDVGRWPKRLKQFAADHKLNSDAVTAKMTEARK